MTHTALNAHCFQQEHWLLIAKGYDVRAWYDEGVGKGSGGIQNPSREHLTFHDRYYRFASGSDPKSAQLGGGWWICFDTFNTLKKYAERNSLDLPYVARLFLALPYEWSRVDRLISARLGCALDAYCGAGKKAKTDSEEWTPPQNAILTQMYVPGLLRNSKENNLFEKAWIDVEYFYTSNLKKAKSPK